MFHFLFRILGALVAAAVAFFGVLVVVAVSLQGAPLEEGVGWMTLAMLVAAIGAFVWMFRRLGSGKWKERHERAQIEKLKRQAVRRNLGPQATGWATSRPGGRCWPISPVSGRKS